MRTDATGATAVSVGFGTAPRWHMPVTAATNFAIASNAPAVGNTVLIGAAGTTPPVGLLLEQ